MPYRTLLQSTLIPSILSSFSCMLKSGESILYSVTSLTTGDISDMHFDTIGAEIKKILLKYLQDIVNKKF